MSPGPDSFPGELLSDKEELRPILLKLLQKTEEEGTLPNSSCEATRSLILKQDKALQIKRENYRGFLGGSVVTNPPTNAGDMGSIPVPR